MNKQLRLFTLFSLVLCGLGITLGQGSPISWTNGQNAIAVIGQKNLSDCSAFTWLPISVAIDHVNSKLWIGDSAGKLRRYPLDTAASGGSFELSLSMSSTGGWANGLWVDKEGGLWVADQQSRVSYWPNSHNLNSGSTPPSKVIGQDTLTSVATNRGTTLNVNTLNGPKGVRIDPFGDFWVTDGNGNNRLLKYSNILEIIGYSSTGSDIAASAVLGQPNFNTGTISSTSLSNCQGKPSFLENPVVGSGSVYLADTSRYRVVRWDNYHFAQSGAAMDAVFGQPDLSTFTTPVGPSSSNFAAPVDTETDGYGGLYVVDNAFTRILYFEDAVNMPDNSQATNVLGQSGFATNVGGCTPNRLNQPLSAVFDPKGCRLFVAEVGNRRVSVWQPTGGQCTTTPSTTTTTGATTTTTTTTTSASTTPSCSASSAGRLSSFLSFI